MIGNSNDETNFPHKLSLTDRQFSNFRKAFTNNQSANANIFRNNCLKQYNQEAFLAHFLSHY